MTQDDMMAYINNIFQYWCIRS